MSIASIAEQTKQTPACWTAPHLFSNPALDYDPADEDYKNLTDAEHATMAKAREVAEQAAVDKCYDCPLMMACEQADIENIDNRAQKAFHILGVVAGRTQAEREMRHGLRVEIKDGSVSKPGDLVEDETEVAEHRLPGDRGPRNQIDDAEVARLTRAGYTSTQIAEHLGCCTRTVTRARDRMGLSQGNTSGNRKTNPATRAPKQAKAPQTTGAASAPASVGVEDSFLAHAISGMAQTVARTEQAAKEAPPVVDVHITGIAFLGGRPLPAATEAVYNYLTAVGGTATWDALVAVATRYVSDEEGHDWWFKQNSTVVNGERVLKSSKQGVPMSERIAAGKQDKVYNAIDATVRKGRYLTRSDPKGLYTFDSVEMSKWVQKMAANAATVSDSERAALVAA